MSSTMTDIKDDMRKDPDDLKREADQARDALEETLYELEQRLSPSVLVDRVATAVKENAGDFSTNLLAQVRNNPVPTVLSSVGLAWLMAASKRPPPRAGDGSNLGERWSSGMRTARDATQGAGEAARSAADTASSAYHSATDAASSAYQSTADAASSAYHTATDAASSAYRTAADTTADAANRIADTTRQTADRALRASRGGMQSVAECYSYLRTEQPLVLGAIAIVAGAAIGALLPTTRAENEWVGDASATAKERLKGEARRRMDDVKEGVARVAEAARQSPDETNADGGVEQRAGG